MPANQEFCLAYLTEDGCQLPRCPKQHRIYRCSCGLIIPLRRREGHEQGRRHAQEVRRLRSQIQTNASGAPAAQSASVSLQPHIPDTPARDDSEEFIKCEVCDKEIPSFRWQFHLTHPEHLRTQQLAATTAALANAKLNKGYVLVSGEGVGVDFGVIELRDSVGSSSTHVQVVTITKTNENARVKLAHFRLTSATGSSILNISRCVIMIRYRFHY